MRLKENSRYEGLRAEILLGVIIAKDCFEDRGYELILTEGTGGKHGRSSKHYIGMAVDIRTRHLPLGMSQDITNDLRKRLGTDFDVVLESDHIHLEFDRK